MRPLSYERGVIYLYLQKCKDTRLCSMSHELYKDGGWAGGWADGQKRRKEV